MFGLWLCKIDLGWLLVFRMMNDWQNESRCLECVVCLYIPHKRQKTKAMHRNCLYPARNCNAVFNQQTVQPTKPNSDYWFLHNWIGEMQQKPQAKPLLYFHECVNMLYSKDLIRMFLCWFAGVFHCLHLFVGVMTNWHKCIHSKCECE